MIEDGEKRNSEGGFWTLECSRVSEKRSRINKRQNVPEFINLEGDIGGYPIPQYRKKK